MNREERALLTALCDDLDNLGKNSRNGVNMLTPYQMEAECDRISLEITKLMHENWYRTTTARMRTGDPLLAEYRETQRLDERLICERAA